jgi:hypothetical protein
MSHKPALADTEALRGESETGCKMSVERSLRDHDASPLPKSATGRGHKTDTSETTRATHRDTSVAVRSA